MFWARTLTNLLWIDSISCSFVEIDWCSCVQLKNKCDTFVFVLRSLSHLFDHLGPEVVAKCLTLFSVSSDFLRVWICARLPRRPCDVRMFHVWWSACLQQFILVSQELKILSLSHIQKRLTNFSMLWFTNYLEFVVLFGLISIFEPATSFSNIFNKRGIECGEKGVFWVKFFSLNKLLLGKVERTAFCVSPCMLDIQKRWHKTIRHMLALPLQMQEHRNTNP